MIPERPIFDSTGMRMGTQMGNTFFDNTGMRAGEMLGNRLILDNRIGADLHVYGNRMDPLSTHTYRYEPLYTDPILHSSFRDPLGLHKDLF